MTPAFSRDSRAKCLPQSRPSSRLLWQRPRWQPRWLSQTFHGGTLPSRSSPSCGWRWTGRGVLSSARCSLSGSSAPAASRTPTTSAPNAAKVGAPVTRLDAAGRVRAPPRGSGLAVPGRGWEGLVWLRQPAVLGPPFHVSS